jgi:predicted ATPase
MRRVIVSGAPGAGKTTLLAELARRGLPTVSDSARELIAERLARGEAPRPEPKAFALELLRRDHAKYMSETRSTELVFYDRSVLESLAMLHEAAPMKETELKARVAAYEFHHAVILLPPWEAIYRTDAERDHTFDHAQRVHLQLVRWYRWCGYEVTDLPRVGVAQRVEHVLHLLAASDA